MKIRSAPLLAVAATLMCYGPARAQDVNALAMKYVNRAKEAKTMRMVFQTNTILPNGMGAVTINSVTVQDLKAGKMHIENTPDKTKTSGPAAAALGAATMTMVDDGQHMWIYMPALNSYSKMPHQAQAAGGMPGTGINLPPGFKLIRTGTGVVDGHPVILANVQAQGIPPTIHLEASVDSSTGQYRKLVVTTSMGSSPGKPGMGTITTVIHFISQEFDVPVTPGLFTFVPPPGATLREGGPFGGRGPAPAPK